MFINEYGDKNNPLVLLLAIMLLLNRLGKQSPPGRSAARPLIGFGSLA